jgi:hypothetical protein
MILPVAETSALATKMKQQWKTKWVEAHMAVPDEVGPE